MPTEAYQFVRDAGIIGAMAVGLYYLLAEIRRMRVECHDRLAEQRKDFDTRLQNSQGQAEFWKADSLKQRDAVQSSFTLTEKLTQRIELLEGRRRST